MDICDQNGHPVDINKIEKPEQDLARMYILEEDTVFELGGRYGSVSCVINSKLKYKTNQVVVEPDERVWSALERNKIVNNCEFNIVKGFVSAKKLDLTCLDDWNGYATTSVENTNSKIPSYTLAEIQEKYKLTFDVLVADCEGFLEQFFDENPTFCDGLRILLFEADYPNKCNYDKIRAMLKDKGFVMKLEGHQNVWLKPDFIRKSNLTRRRLKEISEINNVKKHVSFAGHLKLIATTILADAQQGKTKSIYVYPLDGDNGFLEVLKAEYLDCVVNYVETKGYSGSVVERVFTIDWT
jgi:hypothetical protein